MIRHVVRLVWNRKRSSALLVVELLVSFLVLCSVFSVGAYYLDNYRRPLGFDYDNVWVIGAGLPEFDFNSTEDRARMLATSRDIVRALEGHPEVEHAAAASNSPYSGGSNRWGSALEDGSLYTFFYSEVTPEIRDVLQLELLEGRWLEENDRSLSWNAVVITRSMARDLFGQESPLGRDLPDFDENGNPREREDDTDLMRVVGVVSDYRKAGELAQTRPALFVNRRIEDPERGYPAREYLVRVAAGTTAAFEETLLTSIRRTAPAWSFEVTPIATVRSRELRQRMLPLVIGLIIAGFLTLMVGMGLVGVLWQNVTQRTQELGLRRALGATSGSVRWQILAELLALTTLAVGLGAILFLQVPLLDLIGFVPWRVFLSGTLAALALIYPFVVLCGTYPSWLATRVQPSQALQYE